jgi:hypothetical protein
MLGMSKASDSILAIMAYIPEITRDSRLKSIPLLPVYRVLPESLDPTFLSAGALLYLHLRRRCIRSDNEPNRTGEANEQPETTFGTSQSRRRPRPRLHILRHWLGVRTWRRRQ